MVSSGVGMLFLVLLGKSSILLEHQIKLCPIFTCQVIHTNCFFTHHKCHHWTKSLDKVGIRRLDPHPAPWSPFLLPPYLCCRSLYPKTHLLASKFFGPTFLDFTLLYSISPRSTFWGFQLVFTSALAPSRLSGGRRTLSFRDLSQSELFSCFQFSAFCVEGRTFHYWNITLSRKELSTKFTSIVGKFYWDEIPPLFLCIHGGWSLEFWSRSWLFLLFFFLAETKRSSLTHGEIPRLILCPSYLSVAD